MCWDFNHRSDLFFVLLKANFQLLKFGCLCWYRNVIAIQFKVLNVEMGKFFMSGKVPKTTIYFLKD